MKTFATLLFCSLFFLSPLQAVSDMTARRDYGFKPLIAVCLAMETGGRFDSLRPAAPQPAPGGVCPICKGTGKLGDGTVAVACPTCDGSGKIKKAEPVPPPKATFDDAYDKALAEGKPLAIWVGYECKSSELQLSNMIHVKVSSYKEIKAPAVLVLRPKRFANEDARWLYRAGVISAANCCAANLSGLLNPNRAVGAVRGGG